MKRSIRLKIEPKWHEIEKIRKKCNQFFRSNGLSSNDDVHALIMIISELIENGIKYGNFTLPGNNVIIEIGVADNIVTVEVVNPVDDTAYYHLEKLDKTIQWIRGYQDPFEAFVEKLKEVSKKPLDDEESGLGLVRIAYEGKAILDFFVSEDGFLNVSAVSNY